MEELENLANMEQVLASGEAETSEVATAGAGERVEAVEGGPSRERRTVFLDSQLIEVRLTGEQSKGSFDVLAITQGEGNGWQFSEDALRESVGLWEGVETFIDHGALWAGRSVRDLAGVCHEVRFDEDFHGVRLKIQPFGPSADLLDAIGRDWLEMKGAKPKIGFSADLLFNGKDKNVKQIVKVFSLDLVYRPARGGAFLRVLNSINESQPIEDGILNEETKKMEEHEKLKELSESENESEKELLQAMQETLLESRLSQAKLPEPLSNQVHKQFSGKPFKPAELDQSIQDARELLASLQGGEIIKGAGVISQMVSESERIQAAVDDLLGAERDKEMSGIKVAKLSGIRELYTLLTGDVEMYGKVNLERITLATSDSVSNVLMNSFNKIMVEEWDQLGRAGYRWWEKVVSVEHMGSLQPVSGILLGEVTALSAIAEGTDYGELAVSDSGETKNFVKYGGLLPITIEMIDKDETHKLRQLPKKLVSSAVRNVSNLVSNLFTSGNGTGPIMADGYHVFDAAGHGNIGTAALSATSYEAASQSIYQQGLISEDTAKPKLALDAKYLLVPRNLRLTAMRILYPSFEREATFFTENMQRGELGDVITVPNWSDANDWAAIADPRLAPAIIIAERFGLMPEIFVADNQMSNDMIHNDVINLKVRHFLAIFAADYRPMYKANVA